MNGSMRAHRRSHPNGRGFREAYRAGQGEAAPDMRANVVSVPMSELRAADSPRLNGVDANHVRTLAEVEEPLPPICVHHASMRIIDGMHRVGAARLNGREDIEVVFFDGSDEEAFRLAVKANISHGLPLSLAERQAAAGRILRSHPLQSDRSIGATTGLAAKTVAAIRRRISDAPASARIGRDGRGRPLSTAGGPRIA